MEKTALHEIFLRLVRLGIGHTDTTESTEIPLLSAEDWNEVMALAERQGLLGVVADGVEQLKVKNEELKVDCYLPPKPVMLQMIGQVLQNYEYRHEQYRKAIGELAGFYNSHGFKMMVLKGYACALDWAFFVEKHGSEVDWPWLVETLEEFGLKGFFDVVNAICVEELGFGHTESTESTESSDAAGFKCQVDGGPVDDALRRRVLGDMLEPEFHEEVPQRLLPRAWFRYRRWQANAWKQRLCYSNESRWSAFWSGVWNHLLKPGSV